MIIFGKLFNRVPGLFFIPVFLLLCACSQKVMFTEHDFVGKWRSSKADTPVYIYENGEWEVHSAEGNLLQYGVWQIVGANIMWSYKEPSRAQIEHDINRVLSVTPKQFKVLEMDRTTTTFTRLEQVDGN